MEPHSKRQFMACKPSYHRFRDGDACHLIADTEDGETQARHRNRWWQVNSEERIVNSIVEVGGNCVILNQCAEHHQATGQCACKADAHLVEDDAREEEHEQEYIDETACSGEESVIGWRPTQTALASRHLQQRLKGRHDIVDEIPHHHSSGHDEKHRPPCDGRVVKPT